MSRYAAAVIACGKEKASSPMPAADLYIGPLTRKAVELARLKRLPIFILSALHGLVPESMVLEPYELALHGMPIGKRKAWEARVHQQLHILPPGKLLVFAGALYLPGLRPRLKDVDRPLYGMAIGLQLGELNRLIAVERSNQEGT